MMNDYQYGSEENQYHENRLNSD